ncbi:hypothetical protein SpCBS45565_g00512 [Spizellomyces sp. 'palustris']|nr:hypothetical protein SpCBS45565_g00512 [Spizellomyces sp. 'palustris']
MHAVQVYNYKSQLPRKDVGGTLGFNDVFDLRYETVLTGGHELLCKDFLLFTADHRYMIVVSAVPSGFPRPLHNPSSLKNIFLLDDITFWVLDIEKGQVTDKRVFMHDYIFLSNHAGVHLYDNMLGIASVQNQSIYILHIKDSGILLDVRTIGYLNNEDDELVLARYRLAEQMYSNKKVTGGPELFWDYMDNTGEEDEDSDWDRERAWEGWEGSSLGSPSSDSTPPPLPVRRSEPPDSTNAMVPDGPIDRSRNGRATSLRSFATPSSTAIPYECTPLSGVKQRLMAYLFRKAYASDKTSQLTHFYQTFAHFASLALWRMHFLDNFHIVIKFGLADAIVGKNIDSATSSHTSFFVIYSLATTKVLGVYENTSEELLKLYEDWQVCSGTPYNQSGFSISNPTNSLFAREEHSRRIRAVQKARNGGPVQAVKRVLSGLPFNDQQFVDSPYLDHELFSYDDKAINNVDRARPSGEHPIKFFDRQTGQFKFAIDPNLPLNSRQVYAQVRGVKRYVTCIFHPVDPFILSIQQVNSSLTVVNLHIRREQQLEPDQ